MRWQTVKLADPGSNHWRLSDRKTCWVKFVFQKSESCYFEIKREVSSCWFVLINMEIKKVANGHRHGGEEALKETDACCPCHVCHCVCHVSALLWSLPTCTSSIIHSFALPESRVLITVQPEGGRGERDILCNWTSMRAAQPNVLMCIMGVCVCRCLCVCVWARSWPCFVHCREKDVLMGNSQYSAVVPVEHIRLNLWCWHTAHTYIHSQQIAASASFCGLKNEWGHFLPTDISMPCQRKACGGGSDPGGHFDVALQSYFGFPHCALENKLMIS